MGKNIMDREFVGSTEIVIKYEGKTFGQDQYFVYVNGKHYGESVNSYPEAQKIKQKAKAEVQHA